MPGTAEAVRSGPGLGVGIAGKWRERRAKRERSRREWEGSGELERLGDGFGDIGKESGAYPDKPPKMSKVAQHIFIHFNISVESPDR